MTEYKPLVLIVDDEWLNRELMEGILQLQNYRILTASGGEQALKLVAEKHPDLVLLDVRMPRMDGYEVCRRIKTNTTTRDSLVMMISGLEDNQQERQDALDAGADDFISRSVVMQELTNHIAALLETRRYTAD